MGELRINLQFALENPGFELHGSTDTQIFFNKRRPRYYMIYGWLNPQMWMEPPRGKPDCKVILRFSIARRVDVPNPHNVQESTVCS